MLNTVKRVVKSSLLLEGTARRFMDRRYQLARKFLRGNGLEIGALDRPLWLPRQARAYYLDRMLPRDLRRHYPELDGRTFFVSLVGNGETLDCIRDGSLDFVVANHFIEHAEDPIQTLVTFAKKLRAGGVVFMAVPDKRRTFDVARTETPFEHLLRDHREGAHVSRRGHYEEWVRDVEHLSGDAARVRLSELEQIGYSVHFHCWTLDGFRDFLAHVARDGFAPFEIVASRSWRNENIFVLRKQ